MTEEETIRKIVRETVLETLEGLGFRAREPQEVQGDLLYLRRIRQGSEELARRLRTSFIALAVPTLLYLLWEAIKQELFR